jgi:hypothetical protein
MSETFAIIEGGEVAQLDTEIRDGRVLVAPDDLQRGLGWELKPEGLCLDDICVPVPPGSDVLADGSIDLAAFAALLRRPLAIDIAERVASLGVGADQRGSALASLDAPDFTLPDLEGRMHSLSEHRGEKVFLVAYASW